MRDNTYIKLESICKKYKGYVRTQKLLEEGFSNRQIAFLTKDGYLEKRYQVLNRELIIGYL